MRGIILSVLIVSIWSNVEAQDWRLDYQKKIDTVRKSVIKVDFINGTSDEIVQVRILQKTHDFKWGSTININLVNKIIAEGYEIGSDHPYYNHFLNFNSVTVENAGKWKGWLKPEWRKTYGEMRDWFTTQNIANRGHGTIWESTRFSAVPDFILDETDTAVVRAKIKEHILDQIEELKDEIYELDLVNEPVHEQKIIKDILKVESAAAERAKWHKWARAAAPNLPLVLNEFDLIQSGNDFHTRYVTYVNDYIANGGPVDMIGMQGHFFGAMPEVSELQRRIDELKILNLPMHVTEFDMQESKYEDMEKILYTVFAEPYMTGFTLWGAWDGLQWRNNAPIYAKNWSVKSSGKAYFDLVKGLWSTDSTLVGSEGFVLNAYKGELEAIVEKDGRTLVVPFTLTSDTAMIAIDLSLISNLKPGIEITEEPKISYCENNLIEMEISASDQDGEIREIRFFFDGIKLKTVAGNSASFDQRAVSIGNHSIYAEVIDDKGAITRSDSYDIEVMAQSFNKAFDIIYPNQGIATVGSTSVDILLEWPYNAQNIVSVIAESENGQTLFEAGEEIDIINFSTSSQQGSHEVFITAFDKYGCSQEEIFRYSVFAPDSQNKIISKIQSGIHDSEQLGNGSNEYNGDLDLGQNLAGLYFNYPSLPYGVAIDSAFLQFSSERGLQTGAVTLSISADRDNFPAMLVGFNNLSNRKKTSTVLWDIPDWEVVNERGSKQRTPDLKSIIQELVDNENRSFFSPLVILMGLSTGDAKRSTYGYDQLASAAPELIVYFTMAGLEAPETPDNLINLSQDETKLALKWEDLKPALSTGYYIYRDGIRVNDFPQKELSYSIDTAGLASPTDFSVTAINHYLKESVPSNIYTYQKPIIVLPLSSEKSRHSLYPNPVEDVLHLESKSLHSWKVSDLSGKQYSIQLIENDHEIVSWIVADLPVGLYFLNTTDKQGNEKNYKFLKN